MPSQSQDCAASDIGYATATCTSSLTLQSISMTSSVGISQSQVFINEHCRAPQAQLQYYDDVTVTCTPSTQTDKNDTHSQITESVSDTCTYEGLSQPTPEDYETTGACNWSSAHSDYVHHGYSDSLAQENPMIPHGDGWPPLLKDNYDDFLQNVNLDALLPDLIKNSLLTLSESQELQCYKEMHRRQNQHFLLNVLPRKGRNGFKLFMKCLKAEKEHLGHRYLAEKFCNKKGH